MVDKISCVQSQGDMALVGSPGVYTWVTGALAPGLRALVFLQTHLERRFVFSSGLAISMSRNCALGGPFEKVL